MKLVEEQLDVPIDIVTADFFNVEWKTVISNLPQPILIVGNPPWVTSSDLGQLQSSNLPEKSNFQGRNGLDALTGKSNFDISEWMMLQNITWLENKTGAIAILCKTSVARKIILHSWQKDLALSSTKIFKIDAKEYFDVSVDACLLVMSFGERAIRKESYIFNNLTDKFPRLTWGYQDSTLISDINTYQRLIHLRGEDKNFIWRSGIKHDCAQIMELTRKEDSFINGKAEYLQLESDYVYPMLKSSDIGNNRVSDNRRYMIVTQKQVGDDTSKIKSFAPRTWDYLNRNKGLFSKRGSSIYKNKPDFSIFGIGDYTFSPWKIAISGFYKHLNFVIVPPINGKPVVFDDTVYFLACHSEREARFVFELLNSNESIEFLNSIVYWDNKRPITADLLRKLNLQSLSTTLNREEEYISIVKERGLPKYTEQATQLRLLETREKFNSERPAN